MRKITNITIVLIGLLLSCNNKPIIIEPDLLKYDWETEEDKNHNIYLLRIEDDTLMYQTLAYELYRVASYRIFYDTLFITSDINSEHQRIKQTTFKYKIIQVDSLKLVLKQVFPQSRDRDTIFLNKKVQTKKNDLKIERIEFYSSGCFGTCPEQSLSIRSDSVMYHYGYNSYTKHKGLSKHKLSPVEFSIIQNKLNYIDRNFFGLGVDAVDIQYLRLFIKTPNDSIETSGTFLYLDNDDLFDFVNYLKYKERFINLTPIEDEEISFRYNRD